MIFVTVGTHEQPFDRLVREIDRLKQEGLIAEEVFIQTGYSNYEPRFCDHERFISFDEMLEKIRQAKIVITHGGPGSIMSVLYAGKIPIVVPRQKSFAEHVDDHQIHFAKNMEEHDQILSVYDISEIGNSILGYDKRIEKLKDAKSLNIERERRVKKFATALDEICLKLIQNRKEQGR